jgi:hypothetical protein
VEIAHCLTELVSAPAPFFRSVITIQNLDRPRELVTEVQELLSSFVGMKVEGANCLALNRQSMPYVLVFHFVREFLITSFFFGLESWHLSQDFRKQELARRTIGHGKSRKSRNFLAILMIIP